MAAFIGVSRQFVQTVCNGLYEEEMIEIEDNPRHKRSKLIVPTKKGKNVFERARQKENLFIEKALPGIDTAKTEDARKVLELIRKNLERPEYEKLIQE